MENINSKASTEHTAVSELRAVIGSRDQTISVQKYNDEVYPEIQKALSFISCIDNAIRKSEGDAEKQFRCIGWNDETKKLILDAIDQYNESIKTKVCQTKNSI